MSESDIMNHIALLKEIKERSPTLNVPKIVEHSKSNQTLAIVMEKFDGNDVVQALKTTDVPVTEAVVRDIISNLLSIVSALHSAGVVHRNIAPRNVLVNLKAKPIQVMLAGHTFSTRSNKPEQASQIFGGDASFQAPELFDPTGNMKSNVGLDLWSIGVLCYILLSGSRPFEDRNTMRLYSKIRQGSYQFPDSDWNTVSNEAKDFISHLICVDASKRFNAQSALQHPWISKNFSNAAVLPSVKKNLNTYED